jgi:hypothetical protein
MRDGEETATSRFDKRGRIAGEEPKILSLAVIRSWLTKPNTQWSDGICSIAFKLSLQRGAKFREGMGNGRRPQTQNKKKGIIL